MKTYDVIHQVETAYCDIGIIAIKANDIGIMKRYLSKRDLLFTPFLEAFPHVFIRNNHPLSNKSLITLKALEKYPLQIPESAEFHGEGDGWHSFTVHRQVHDGLLFDGTLRVRYARDGTVREIGNGLLSYTYYRDVDVIAPEEALKRLQAGKFNDEGYFEHKDPVQVSVLSCILDYRVDTKGFYQPVYVFDVKSLSEGYDCRIVIPAMK